MSNNNIENTLLKKTAKLLEQPQGTLNFFDIDYQLLEDPDNPYRTVTRKMVEHNFEAILNPVRMWLQSNKDDYIRQKGWGGLFQYSLNDRFAFRPENENSVRDLLISELNQKFPDLNVVDCTVKCERRDRNWDVEIIVQDKHTNNIGAISEKIKGSEE